MADKHEDAILRLVKNYLSLNEGALLSSSLFKKGSIIYPYRNEISRMVLYKNYLEKVYRSSGNFTYYRFKGIMVRLFLEKPTRSRIFKKFGEESTKFNRLPSRVFDMNLEEVTVSEVTVSRITVGRGDGPYDHIDVHFLVKVRIPRDKLEDVSKGKFNIAARPGNKVEEVKPSKISSKPIAILWGTYRSLRWYRAFVAGVLRAIMGKEGFHKFSDGVKGKVNPIIKDSPHARIASLLESKVAQMEPGARIAPEQSSQLVLYFPLTDTSKEREAVAFIEDAVTTYFKKMGVYSLLVPKVGAFHDGVTVSIIVPYIYFPAPSK